MANATNRKITLAARPVGYPKESDFAMVEEPVADPGPGQVLIRTLWLSLDPYQRGRMSAAKSYATPVDIGGVITGGIVGRVEQSNNPKFKAGDFVEGWLGWQSWAISDGNDIRKVDPDLAPLQTALGILGMPGMTAYFGFLEIGLPRPGDTVVISAASGAVGQLVGQIARIMGCRAVGIAGGADKCAYIRDELGFDAAIDYKGEDVEAAIARHCPDGVDVYFDNVGGTITEAVLKNLAKFARVVICGQISQYNLDKPDLGPRNLRFLLVNQARMEGFLVFQFADRYEQGMKRIAGWIKDGRIKYREDVVDGLENAPKAFIGMMEGKNFGKLLVKVAEV
ncbi:MAG: NADP-dependent oxidoreductase [Rhodospirillaceae bacterium]|nr:NADP-dependent oxidoreductase [Rhodospirillaceae bacterium]